MQIFQVCRVLGIFFVEEGAGFGDVTELRAAKDVAIGFRTDFEITVIGAGHCDLGKVIGVGDFRISDLVHDVEGVV